MERKGVKLMIWDVFVRKFEEVWRLGMRGDEEREWGWGKIRCGCEEIRAISHLNVPFFWAELFGACALLHWSMRSTSV